MQKSESIASIAKALAAFQKETKNPANTAKNPFFNSKYAPLSDILNDARPLLSKNGLSILQAPSGDGEKIIITTLILHESGEWIEPEPLILRAEKTTAQGAGSAITYGRRYALSALLGISSEDDDDGNSSEKGKAQGEKKSDPPKQEKPKQQAASTTEDKSSESQQKAIHAIAGKKGIDVAAILGRDYGVESTKELTKKQASELIDRLQKEEQSA